MHEKILLGLLVFGFIALQLSPSPAEENPPQKKTGAANAAIVTARGKPVTLLGNEVNIGDTAPKAILIANDLSEFDTSKTAGIRVFTTVPSLDTAVCDRQVRRFNEEAAKLPNVSIYAISADLPFAQKRWCGGAGIKNLKTLSDHREMAFADAWGVHIKESRLLARAVFVVDSSGKIAYMEIVKEMSHEPDYEKVLEALKTVK